MNSISLNADLAAVSRLVIEGAMLVYTFAFLTFVFHLSQLASTKKKVRAGATKLERVGIVLLAIAAVIHGVGVVLRGIAASRVPWANMYEFSITGSFVVVTIFLFALIIKDIRLIATFVAGFNLLILGTADTVFYVAVKSLMPALQSYWLVIHVMVAVLATAFFNIAAALYPLITNSSTGKITAAVGLLVPDAANTGGGTIDNYDKAAAFLKSLDSSRLSDNELTKAIIAAIGDLDADLAAQSAQAYGGLAVHRANP